MEVRRGLVVGGALIALYVCAAPVLAQDKPIVLRFAGTIAVTHHISKGMVLFSESVAKKTGGRVKIETYPASTLFKASDLSAAISSGAVDMGHNITAVWSKAPIADVMDLPFLIRDSSHAEKAWAKDGPLFKAYAADMAKRGMKTLHVKFYGSLFDFINNGRQLRTPADFKGMKIRSYGALAAESLRTLGATPIVMDPSEYYMALQRGTIDGVITGVSSIDAAKLWEAGKYATQTSAGFAAFVVNMNTSHHDRLPDDIKRAIQAAGDEVQAWSADESKRGDAKSVEFLRGKVQFHVLTASERQEWARVLQPVMEAWTKRASKEERDVVDWIKSLR